MSKMKTDSKPPLARSPIRVRPRRVLRSNSSSLQTPPDIEESDLRPEYRTISCEFQALAKMVQDELGDSKLGNNNNKARSGTELIGNSSFFFERGRFYEDYSARRNERLKRKKNETGDTAKTPYELGVTVESSKRRESKKLEGLRKSVSAAYSVERSEPRYTLRSMTKENKKPPLPFNSVIDTQSKTGARRVRKI
ncbi:uncharacterized protein LOC123202628 isoform X2 [Mangifera indica]|uniref:uncharacterized protein LOC123202628 isoform X2 n=1 Tax=Mangifera indica TaxID=29780 RepID=UPI001CFBB0D8|nr:uncharacterized protein LOC123202628 isoform X2 [Mangifera indica]